MYKNIFFKKIEKMLDKFESIGYNNQALRDADVAHPVERHLAKVEVASSSLVIRSILLMPIKFNWHFFDRASVQFNTAP